MLLETLHQSTEVLLIELGGSLRLSRQLGVLIIARGRETPLADDDRTVLLRRESLAGFREVPRARGGEVAILEVDVAVEEDVGEVRKGGGGLAGAPVLRDDGVRANVSVLCARREDCGGITLSMN